MNCLYCNGELEIEQAHEKIQCKYCGRWNALPDRQTQEQQALLERAMQKQALWRFDEAEKDYEELLTLEPDDAGTHWKALLCHYGVEYVVEPGSGRSLPTITHHEIESIFDNEHYKRAIALTEDENLRKTYLNEATHINEILQLHEKLAATQKPYDIFISVKQGDESGRPTSDSFEAMKLAVFLEEKGLRVFNSRKSLSEMVGLEYEPYIMTALFSASAMIVVASSREAMEARWVQNEWRRFRWLQENDKHRKRLLIPYLLGMSMKDVPVEMQAIQCVSNTSASPFSDILHGVRKVIPIFFDQVPIPSAMPGGITDEQKKEEWYRKNLSFLETYRSLCESPIPDDVVAKAGMNYLDIVKDNFSKLGDFGDSSQLARDAEQLRSIFATEHAKFVCDTLSKDFALCESKTKEPQIQYQAAQALLGEMNRIKSALVALPDYAPAQDLLSRVAPQLEKMRLQARRLDPSNIVTDRRRSALAVGDGFVAGLRTDGTVLVEGKKAAKFLGTLSWRHIISIAAGQNHLVGLRNDGSVVAAGDNGDGQCNVGGMKGILSIAAAGKHTVCLGRSGAVYATGNNRYHQIAVEEWKNVVSIATAQTHTLGLKSDGHVLATGDSRNQLCNTSGWTNIESVIALNANSIGSRQNGEIYVLGPNADKLMKNLNKSQKQLVTSAYSSSDITYVNLLGSGKANVVGYGNKRKLLACGIILILLSLCALAASSLTGDSSAMTPFQILMVLDLLTLLVPFVARNIKRIKLIGKLRTLPSILDVKCYNQDVYLVLDNHHVYSSNEKTMPQWLDIGLPDQD